MSTPNTAAAAAAKWSKTASSYVKYFEPSGSVTGRFLLNCLKLQFQDQPLKVLEAGCGAGGLAKELMLNLNGLSVSELVLTDVADGMLEKTQERLHDFIDNKNQNTQVKIEKADFT